MRHYLLCLLVFCLAACETAIEVDVPRYPAQLTVNGLFNPDSVWRVELTQNRSILDNAPFAPVPDAEVQVLQNEQTVAVLEHIGESSLSGNSLYRTLDERPEPGVDYTLEVSHPTLGRLTSGSEIPETQASILSAEWDTLDIRDDPELIGGRLLYGVTIRFDDPQDENYYSVSIIFQQNSVGIQDINKDGLEEFVFKGSRLGTIGIKSDDPIVDEPFNRIRAELLFKDESFNGSPYELKLYMAQPTRRETGNVLDLYTKGDVLGEDVYDLQGNILYKAGEPFAPPNAMYVLLRTTTEEYYNYHYTRDLQASVESNPFAQPVQVFDNVEGGLGIFAGYNQVEKKLTFR